LHQTSILRQKSNWLFAPKAKLNTFVAPKSSLGWFLQGDVAHPDNPDSYREEVEQSQKMVT